MRLTTGVIISQSTLRQVFENPESTQRQYALRRRAIALGWPEERIIFIDHDQGQSGASAVDREGFQRLVTEVGLGKAGIVMGSRLKKLVSLCHLLQKLAGDEPFYLACRTVQRLFNLKTHEQAAVWLRVLRAMKILDEATKGGPNNMRATRYRYCPVAPAGGIGDLRGEGKERKVHSSQSVLSAMMRHPVPVGGSPTRAGGSPALPVFQARSPQIIETAAQPASDSRQAFPGSEARQGNILSSRLHGMLCAGVVHGSASP